MAGAAGSGEELTGASGCAVTTPTGAVSTPPVCGDGMEDVGAGSMLNGLEAKRVTSDEQPARRAAAKPANAIRGAAEAKDRAERRRITQPTANAIDDCIKAAGG